MLDYQGFTSRAKAKATIAALRGWPHAIVREKYLPEHSMASRRPSRNGFVWVIEVDPGKYLREDGYIR